MKIRIANANDLPQIVEIYNHAVAQGGATADLTPVTVASRQEWFSEHKPNSWPIWVAQNDHDTVGWCSLSPYRPGRMALRHTAEISYYIHAARRRQGIGTRLIQHAIGQCPTLGIKNLFTLLLDVNVPSIRILEQFGFAKWGHMPSVAEFNGTICGHLIYGMSIGQQTKDSEQMHPEATSETEASDA